jgi:hypothetical protein
MQECKILGIKPIKVGQILNLKDGKRKIKNIEYINMSVDRIDFEDGESIFSRELKDVMQKESWEKMIANQEAYNKNNN